jgi:CHAT domain-containing protein
MATGDGSTLWVDLDKLTSSPWDVGLVVLAGCSTGLTGRRDGYQLISVASQILQAGAATVIASLWPVGDAAAQLTMQSFHRALKDDP